MSGDKESKPATFAEMLNDLDFSHLEPWLSEYQQKLIDGQVPYVEDYIAAHKGFYGFEKGLNEIDDKPETS